MTIWITGKDLIENEGLKSFELLDRVCNGLQPYDPETGKSIPPPNISAKLRELKELKKRVQELENRFGYLKGPPEKIEIRLEEMDGSIDKLGMKRYFDAVYEKAAIREYGEKNSQVEIIEQELSADDINSWKGYTSPESKQSIVAIINSLKESIYKRANVESEGAITPQATSQASAKRDILRYAETRRKEGRLLVRADFSPKNIKPRIEQIQKDHSVELDTLRRHCAHAGLLGLSKPGPKKKPDENP